jgi:hypothetical protein
MINVCDSKVSNRILDNGCTMNDMIAECAEGAKNHGQFVNCVTHLTNDWKNEGLISGKDKGAIQNCAAKSNCPSENPLLAALAALNDAIDLETEAEANMMVGRIEDVKQLVPNQANINFFSTLALRD